MMEKQETIIDPLQCGDCGNYYDLTLTPYIGVCPTCYMKNKVEYDAILFEKEKLSLAEVS